MRKHCSFCECDERRDPYRTKYILGLEDESIAGTKQTIPQMLPRALARLTRQQFPARFGTCE